MCGSTSKILPLACTQFLITGLLTLIDRVLGQERQQNLKSSGHVMGVESLHGGGRGQWCGRAGAMSHSMLFRCKIDIRVFLCFTKLILGN